MVAAKQRESLNTEVACFLRVELFPILWAFPRAPDSQLSP